ncbi:MAG: hypothetical protein J6Y28_08665 [Acholeplasmatales bacterium]|nr:hypothetical protein [Acholeplasmatales bacterium]
MKLFDEWDDFEEIKQFNEKVYMYNRLKGFIKLYNIDLDICSFEDFVLEYDNYPNKDTFIEDMQIEMEKYAKLNK